MQAPWVNTDDIRLTPQSNEAYTLSNKGIPGLEIVASHVTKIRGMTSSDFESMSKFAGIKTEDEPVTLAGLVYTGIKGLKLQFWDFYGHEYFNNLYFRADYDKKITDDLSWFGGFQYLNQDDLGDQIGGSLNTYTYSILGGIKSYGLTFTLAGAQVGDQDIVYPWGCDLMVSVQINDCFRADETGILASLVYDFGEIGIKGLAASVTYVNFDTPDSGINLSLDIDEIDFDLRYEFSGALQGLGLRGRYAIVDEDELLGGEDLTDFRFYLTYDFSF